MKKISSNVLAIFVLVAITGVAMYMTRDPIAQNIPAEDETILVEIDSDDRRADFNDESAAVSEIESLKQQTGTTGAGAELEGNSIELVTSIDVSTIAMPDPVPGSVSVGVGVFLYGDKEDFGTMWSLSDAAELVGFVMASSEILGQCNVNLELEVAQVIALPEELDNVQGNSENSWGGHPPEGFDDVDKFNYYENERLTPETRELFAYGKRFTSPNAISVFVVPEITYYIGGAQEQALTLSFAPNLYHHEDDYPLRNSILIATHPNAKNLPDLTINGVNFTSQALGHMLLNTASDIKIYKTLRNGSLETVVSTDQCKKMPIIAEWLYGKEAVIDPGLPE